MRLIAGLLVIGALAACDRTERGLDPSDFDGQPRCGAENYQDLLGQPEAALDSVTLPAATRILRPGDVIALDFSPDRLTIDIDDLGRISSVTCR